MSDMLSNVPLNLTSSGYSSDVRVKIIRPRGLEWRNMPLQYGRQPTCGPAPHVNMNVSYWPK